MKFTTSDMDIIAARVRAKREPLGLNVRFLRTDGSEDSFSFATDERAGKFRAALRRQGRTVLS